MHRAAKDTTGATADFRRRGDLDVPAPRLRPDATLESVAAKLGVTTDLCKLALDILLWQRLSSRLPNLLPTVMVPDTRIMIGVLFEARPHSAW